MFLFVQALNYSGAQVVGAQIVKNRKFRRSSLSASIALALGAFSFQPIMAQETEAVLNEVQNKFQGGKIQTSEDGTGRKDLS